MVSSMARDVYESPLSARYADKEMKYLFSPDMKFRTWRKLWIALAEAEMELGLPVTQAQVDELKAHAEDINYEVAQEREKGGPPRRDEPCLRLWPAVPRRPRASSTWAPPPAMWGITPMSSS